MSSAEFFIVNGKQIPVNDPHQIFEILHPIIKRKALTIGRGHIAEGRHDAEDLSQEYMLKAFELSLLAPKLAKRFAKRGGDLWGQFVKYIKTGGANRIKMTTRFEKAESRDYQATKSFDSMGLDNVNKGCADQIPFVTDDDAAEIERVAVKEEQNQEALKWKRVKVYHQDGHAMKGTKLVWLTKDLARRIVFEKFVSEHFTKNDALLALGYNVPTRYKHPPGKTHKNADCGVVFLELDEIHRHFHKPDDRKVIAAVVAKTKELHETQTQTLTKEEAEKNAAIIDVFTVARNAGYGEVRARNLRRDYNNLVKEYMG